MLLGLTTGFDRIAQSFQNPNSYVRLCHQSDHSKCFILKWLTDFAQVRSSAIHSSERLESRGAWYDLALSSLHATPAKEESMSLRIARAYRNQNLIREKANH